MTTPTPMSVQLEQVVDRIGLANTVELLALICDLKDAPWQMKVLDTVAAQLRKGPKTP
jgi:hypothetical protein